MATFDENLNNLGSNSENNNIENHTLNNQPVERRHEPIEAYQNNEATDALLKRFDHSYQFLAAAVIRARQAKQELQTRANATATQIEQHKQQLTQISEQLVNEQAEIMPQNEQEATQQLDAMKGCVREKHYNNLVTQLHELHQANHLALPKIIDSMRAELDLIEIRAQKIRILENLREAYKSNQYFQQYYERADEEFRSLLAQY